MNAAYPITSETGETFVDLALTDTSGQLVIGKSATTAGGFSRRTTVVVARDAGLHVTSNGTLLMKLGAIA